MKPGTQWTAQHIELAIALSVVWDEYAEAKQNSAMEWEAAGTALPRRTTTIVLVAALCEAVANLYLALKLDAQEFKEEERKTPLNKWTTVIAQIVPGYKLEESDQRVIDLKFLYECRNSVMHSKAKMSEGGAPKHAGTADLWEQIDEAAVARVWNLPLRLLDNLITYEYIPAVFIRSGIAPYLTDVRLQRGLAEQAAIVPFDPAT